MEIALAISQTIVKGTALQWNGGYLEIGTTGSTDIRFVAMQDVTTDGSSHTKILCVPVEGVRFEADCDAVASIADIGTYCQLATGATLNPDDSTVDCFLIDEIVGTAEVSTKVKGRFVHALGN